MKEVSNDTQSTHGGIDQSRIISGYLYQAQENLIAMEG